MRKVTANVFVHLTLAAALYGQTGDNGMALHPASLALNADWGNSRSLLEGGRAAEEGKGRPQSYADARRLYEQAAQLGLADANLYLGRLYLEGWGVTRDLPRAAGLIEKAATANVRSAQLMLSDMYALGIGVKRDPAKAVQWAEKAAVADDAAAGVKLGKLIERGQGVAPDVKVARDWYQLSAEQDYTQAMNAMAQSFLKPGASDLDREYAARWLELAVANGNTQAAYVLAVLCVARGPDDPAELARAEGLLEQAAKGRRSSGDAHTVLKKKAEGLSLVEAFRYVLGTPRENQMADQRKARVAKWETAAYVPPRQINWTPPHLPESVRLQQLKGAVRLSCTITKAGLVEDIKVLSSPHPSLTEAVVAHVKRARYIPALKNGQRIAIKMTMNIDPTHHDSGLNVMSLPAALPAEISSLPAKSEKP